MIFVSTACVKSTTIRGAVELLLFNGFKNIELSGGTEFYDGIYDDILEMQTRHGINFLVHNYFPPPSKGHFVLNLASLDNEIYEKTLSHFAGSIEFCKKLGIRKFGFHGGFYVDLDLSELARKINRKPLSDREKSIERFCDGFTFLSKLAGEEIDLYIENNVFSSSNHDAFSGRIPFMLINFRDYLELKKLIDFKLLLDVGHLKVSCMTLGLDFGLELMNLANLSDYLHLSDNDGLHDQNLAITSTSDIIEKLRGRATGEKTLTLEINGIDELKRAYKAIGSIL